MKTNSLLVFKSDLYETFASFKRCLLFASVFKANLIYSLMGCIHDTALYKSILALHEKLHMSILLL
jgi:hypothetical protein